MSSAPSSTRNHSQRVLLKDRAYEELKMLIQTGVLEAESSVSERHLVERLGMSKTPIRAALELLEQQGLVAVSPQKGILIKELSARDVGELFEIRNSLEPFVVSELAARSISSIQISQLQENLDSQQIYSKSGNAVESTRLDIEFHKMLASFLDNREMMGWLDRCFDKLHRSILRINRLVPGRLMKSTEDHIEIVAAVQQGQRTEVAQLMRSHLKYGRAFLLGASGDHDV